MIYFRRLSKARHQEVIDSFEPVFQRIWAIADQQIEQVMPELKQQDGEMPVVYQGVREIYHDRILKNYCSNVEDVYRHEKGASDLSLEQIESAWGDVLYIITERQITHAYLPTYLMHCLCGDENLDKFIRIISDMKATFAACPDMDSEEIERERQATRKRLASVWRSLEPWSRELATDEMLDARLEPFV